MCNVFPNIFQWVPSACVAREEMSIVHESEIVSIDDCMSDSVRYKEALCVPVRLSMTCLCVMYWSKGENQIMRWMSGLCQTLLLVTSILRRPYFDHRNIHRDKRLVIKGRQNQQVHILRIKNWHNCPTHQEFPTFLFYEVMSTCDPSSLLSYAHVLHQKSSVILSEQH